MKLTQFKKLIREEVRKVIRESAAPITKADLIAKLEPLKKLFPKITDRDLKTLTFVGNREETKKIYKALSALRVQDYFDPPNDDSEASGPGTWVIDTMSASDEGLIKEEKREVITLTYNTDPDDLEYVKKVLATAGVEAIVAAGTFDDEVEIIIKPNLKQKAIKALQGDGFDI